MRQILAIVLVLTMAFIFTACEKKQNAAPDAETTTPTTNIENTDPTSPETNNGDKVNDEGVSESDWTAAVQAQKFENVTFTSNATFISGYYSDVGPHINVFKITENGMTADGELLSEDEQAALKTMYIDTVTAVVNNFDQFVYNKENDYYTSKESVVYNTTILGYSATLTCDDVVVVFDANNNIAKISCKMTQEFMNDGNELTTYVLSTEFTFTDYGTTTLE